MPTLRETRNRDTCDWHTRAAPTTEKQPLEDKTDTQTDTQADTHVCVLDSQKSHSLHGAPAEMHKRPPVAPSGPKDSACLQFDSPDLTLPSDRPVLVSPDT